MKYRIHLDVSPDGVRFYFPQYKKFFHWHNFGDGIGSVFPTEKAARDFIEEYKRLIKPFS